MWLGCQDCFSSTSVCSQGKPRPQRLKTWIRRHLFKTSSVHLCQTCCVSCHENKALSTEFFPQAPPALAAPPRYTSLLLLVLQGAAAKPQLAAPKLISNPIFSRNQIHSQPCLSTELNLTPDLSPALFY